MRVVVAGEEDVYYLGTITRGGKKLSVKFDDGDSEVVTKDEIIGEGIKKKFKKEITKKKLVNYLKEGKLPKAKKEKDKKKDKGKKIKIEDLTVDIIKKMKKDDLEAVAKIAHLDVDFDDKLSEIRNTVIEELELDVDNDNNDNNDDAVTEDEIREMGKKALLAFIKENDLDIDDDEWKKVDDLRTLIIEMLALDDNDNDDDDNNDDDFMARKMSFKNCEDTGEEIFGKKKRTGEELWEIFKAYVNDNEL